MRVSGITNVCVAGLLGVSVAGAAQAAAATSANVTAVYGNGGLGYDIRDDDGQFGSGSSSASLNHSGTFGQPFANGKGNATAYAAFGVLKLSTSVESLGGYISYGANAEWSDRVIWTSLAGGYATAHVSVLVDGFLSGESNPPTVPGDPARWGSYMNVNLNASLNRFGALSVSGFDGWQGTSFRSSNGLEIDENAPGFGTYSVDIRFLSGQPLLLSMTGTCSSLASRATQSAACELGHSIYWGGITSITNDDGTTGVLTSAASDSGTDYSRSAAPASAVAEPATWATLIVGLGAIGGTLRSQRRQRVVSA